MIGAQRLCDLESRAVLADDAEMLALVTEVRRLHLELAKRARLAAQHLLAAQEIA